MGTAASARESGTCNNLGSTPLKSQGDVPRTVGIKVQIALRDDDGGEIGRIIWSEDDVMSHKLPPCGVYIGELAWVLNLETQTVQRVGYKAWVRQITYHCEAITVVAWPVRGSAH